MAYGKTKTKNKITPEIDQDLRILAKTLPEAIKCAFGGIPVTTRRSVTGAQLIKRGQKVLENGSRVNPNAIYTQDVPVKINHIEELYFHYQKNGMEGVDSYVSTVKHHDKLRTERILRGMPWYRRWWLRICEFMKKVNEASQEVVTDSNYI